MAFKRDSFSPIMIVGVKVPRFFAYANNEDNLEDMMVPGYFNTQRIILLPNSFIKVIAKDCAAEIVVGPQDGMNVTIRPDYFLAKFAEEMEEIKPVDELTPAQKRANTIARKKEEVLALAQTG